jgi:hypothetical protein
MTQAETESKLYCLLIGINCYLPNKLPNGLYYKSLLGCVQDIERLYRFLQDSLKVPKEQIIKLTSSTSEQAGVPVEPPSQWPTYKNIVEGFKGLTDVANPGDQIFIHYSGHGGRATTTDNFKGIKGEQGIDEVLVPMDLGNSEGNYLRDTDLHLLIRRMVDKGLIVTIVLDSCHAGGALRGVPALIDPESLGTGVRGVGVVDTLPRSQQSLAASDDELRSAWLQSSKTRNVQSNAGWLLQPEGYTLIAACRANEYANEVVFEGTEKNGALSYWLVDSLQQLNADFTYAKLHSRLLAKVHGQFAEQTPQLEGEGDRVVFGVTNRLPFHSIAIQKLIDENTIQVNAGKAQGILEGSHFAIYPFAEIDLSNPASRIALVEVTKVNATDSIATVLERTAPVALDGHAVLLDAGTIKLRGKIQFVDNSQNGDSAALRKIAELMELETAGTNSVVKEGETPEYVVTLAGDNYLICDAAGIEIPNLRPVLKTSDPEAPRKVIERLSHLVKFNNVSELDNNSPFSTISQKLVVELVERPKDFVPGEPTKPQNYNSLGQSVAVHQEDWAFLRIANGYSAVLNITVLDLQPDWGISQIFPGRAASFETLDPGRDIMLPMRVRLPNDFEQGRDIIKVFATLTPTDFRCLEMAAQGEPELNTAVRGIPENDLEEFLAGFARPGQTRTVEIPVCATVEWCTHQVEIEIMAQNRVAAVGD